jgi:hypothetical protein
MTEWQPIGYEGIKAVVERVLGVFSLALRLRREARLDKQLFYPDVEYVSLSPLDLVRHEGTIEAEVDSGYFQMPGQPVHHPEIVRMDYVVERLIESKSDR